MGTADPRPAGVHDVHQNQGNIHRYADDNGVWQDGGLLVQTGSTWTAILLRFQSQSWRTTTPRATRADTTRGDAQATAHRRDQGDPRPAAPAVMASLSPDGSPLSVPTWYLLEDDGRVLINMDDRRVRLEHVRHDPRVALTVLGENWYRHVSLQGRIVEIKPDTDFKDIDRLSKHYGGEPYPNREHPRTSAWIEIDHWHGWHV